MKRILFASAALIGLALPQSASAQCGDGICLGFGFRVRACFKFNFCFEPCGGCAPACGPACAPWWSHFPPQPHCYGPAPMAMYPNWPAPVAQGMRIDMPALNAQGYNPYTGLQHASYYGAAPSYWYGR